LNKKLIAIGIGALFAANGAFAQSAGNNSVEIYGIIDLAVGTVNHQLNTDGAFPATVNTYSATKSATVSNSVTGMFNGGISDSRWGLRGTEDLGGGLKAIFTLESGINANTGQLNNGAQGMINGANTTVNNAANTSLNGQLFNRQAFVGLSDANLGKITFGRNYAPIFDIVVAYDPVQASQAFSPLGFSGTLGGGGGASEDTRVDNSMKYSNTISGVNFGALYKFGGQAGSTSAQSGYAFNLGYEAGSFGIQGAYEHFTDAMVGAQDATAGDIKVTAENTSAWFVAAKYGFGAATIRGGMERYAAQAASDYYGAGTFNYYGYTAAPDSSTYGWTSGATNGAPDKDTDVYFIGGDYNFTPALNLAVGYYGIVNEAFGNNALGKGATASNNIRAWSALLDYHFSKRTDVYAGFMDMSYGGSYAVAGAGYNTSNYIAAFGIRTKF